MQLAMRAAAICCAVILVTAYLSAQEAATAKIDGTWIGRVGRSNGTTASR